MSTDLSPPCPNADCSDGLLFRAPRLGAPPTMFACNRCEAGKRIAEQVRYRDPKRKRFPWRIPMWRPRFGARAWGADRRVRDD